jgi:hypothetical protein
MIVAGTKVKGKGRGGWIGTVVAIGAPPSGYNWKMMPRYVQDSGDTVWVEWAVEIGIPHESTRRQVFGYPMSTIERLQVVS